MNIEPPKYVDELRHLTSSKWRTRKQQLEYLETAYKRGFNDGVKTTQLALQKANGQQLLEARIKLVNAVGQGYTALSNSLAIIDDDKL